MGAMEQAAGGAPCSPNLLVARAGLVYLWKTLTLNSPQESLSQTGRSIYCQQIWPLGLPCQAKGTHSSLGRRGLSPGKERGVGPWRQRAGRMAGAQLHSG